MQQQQQQYQLAQQQKLLQKQQQQQQQQALPSAIGLMGGVASVGLGALMAGAQRVSAAAGVGVSGGGAAPVDSSACALCSTPFSVLVWKHSCLMCMRAVCSACKTDTRLALADGRRKRVCRQCLSGKQ